MYPIYIIKKVWFKQNILFLRKELWHVTYLYALYVRVALKYFL